MPPLFGILRPDLQLPDQIKTSRMADSAKYVVPRKLIIQSQPGMWMAAAQGRDNRETDGSLFSRLEDLVIMADASLYNKRELILRLGNNQDAEDKGDAELILLAYAKWGDQCLAFLYGDFAFVIFNTSSGEIFCGRDPMGVRPLFYAQQESSFIYSSELRLVPCALDKAPGVDKEYVFDSLMGVKSPKDKSPFENIFRLPPAHYLTFKKGEIRVIRYWMPDVHATIELAGEEEYIAMFRELIVNAVNLRCQGVTSLGAELSGGLDSSTVTGIAADLAKKESIPFTAFSNVFPEDSGIKFKDEREFIGDLIAFKNLEGIKIDRLGIGISELLKFTTDTQGVFIQQNFNMFNYGLFKAAAEKGTSTLLSGFGGDEMASARVSLPWNELIMKRQWSVIKNELFYRGITPRSLLKAAQIATRYLVSRIYMPRYSRGVFTPELLEKRFNNLPLKPEYLEEHQLKRRYREKYRTPRQENVSSRQLYRINMEHLPQRMEYGYAAAAQFGIEYRYPLLDVNLILACMAFPPWLKQHKGMNRYLFRQAITGYVPESIRQRNDKSGSTIPHTYFSLVHEKDLILGLIREAEGVTVLDKVFDFTRFPTWYEKLVKKDEKDMNYINPGAFYTYLMMMKYYGSNE